jgi:hypothetical protein
MYQEFRAPFAESSMPAQEMSIRTQFTPAEWSLSRTAVRSVFE